METKPSGLGRSLEEVVSAFDSTVEKQVVQENLEEYIAALSGEGSLHQTLDSDQDFERLEKEVESSVVDKPQGRFIRDVREIFLDFMCGHFEFLL